MSLYLRSILGIAAVWAVWWTAPRVSGQAPPNEVNGHVLMDVGPIPAPAVCGCVTSPFTVVAPRGGWGYGSGPAAPDTPAAPARFERRLQSGRDAEDRANFPRYVENALAGHANEAFALGLLYTAGTAVKRNDEQALRWFRLAARHGHPDSYVQLGHRYHRGLGVAQNDKAAAYWFFMGASSQNKLAMTALGGLYAAGKGVAQDWGAALYWWEKADNFRFVGDAYACGLGVAQDNERALALYQQASDAGDAMSTIQVGHMHAGRCTSRPDDEAAFAAYKRAADEGYPEAQISLSEMYLDGRGVPVSAYHAYLWARLAELRVRRGSLREQAAARGAAAARFLSAFERGDADRFVKGLIAAGTTPMNR